MDTSMMDHRFITQPRQRKTAPAPPKKRKIQHTVEEVTWDKAAREEYLTGFHKRKLARKKHAQEINEEKERQARIAMRKQIREGRRQAVEEHVQTITKILRDAEAAGAAENGQEDGEEEWGGLSDNEVPEVPPLELEEEYIDEDKYTTVTVEAVSVDRDGMHKPKIESSDDESDPEKEQFKQDPDNKKEKQPREKKKKFRYETKFDRDLAARKQKAKRRKAQGRD
ncbi:nucleolar protein 12-domain-containing protein [Podospora fimiseda]|uniref:Nucleolar protein 12-domain-containing protein n=1 Tax=Podospora fimiseda TaxID=252190 RepID=A0AAN7BVK6_9PEZI|nr:nucleolar protein 12-domain-containing protein [Podospora fimiseda]